MQQESVPLWKLAVGVALGVLLADVIRMAFAALAIGGALGSWGVSTENPGKVTQREPLRSVQRSQPAPPPEYHGPITARSRSVMVACIGGTIAYRKDNGWSQDLEGGRSHPCRAVSQ